MLANANKDREILDMLTREEISSVSEKSAIAEMLAIVIVVMITTGTKGTGITADIVIMIDLGITTGTTGTVIALEPSKIAIRDMLTRESTVSVIIVKAQVVVARAAPRNVVD